MRSIGEVTWLGTGVIVGSIPTTETWKIIIVYLKMKNCINCNVKLNKEDFPLVNKNTGKRSAKCIDCKKEYDRKWWAKNKKRRSEIKRKQSKINYERNKKHIVSYLKNNPCVDCGEDNFIVLEFDHVRGKKLFNLGTNCIYSIKKINEEIEKCDVRCANCHRIKTAIQFGWYKYS